MTSERKTVPDNGLAADLHTAPQIHREDSVQDAIIEDQYAHLVETVRNYNPAADFVHIESAYHFAKRCHEGQRRKSGEPYIIHPLAVADIVPCGVIRFTAISLLTGGVLALVVFLAIWYPARKAARQEPADALRYDG